MDIRVLIIDPDEEGRLETSGMIEKYFSQTKIVNAVGTLRDGMVILSVEYIDLIILDIGCKKGEGLELFDFISSDQYRVIFTSNNYNQLEDTVAFNPFGYLLKPLVSDSLRTAVNRAN